MSVKIPISEKPFLGLRLGNGTNAAMSTACQKMGMTRSEFARYCIISILQDLSLVSQQVKKENQGELHA